MFLRVSRLLPHPLPCVGFTFALVLTCRLFALVPDESAYAETTESE
jgi:hypothetical protein